MGHRLVILAHLDDASLAPRQAEDVAGVLGC